MTGKTMTGGRIAQLLAFLCLTVGWSVPSRAFTISSNLSPAATFDLNQDQLHVVFVANDGTNRLMHFTSTDRHTAGSVTAIGNCTTRLAPAVQMRSDGLHIAYVADDGTNEVRLVRYDPGTRIVTTPFRTGRTTRMAPAFAQMSFTLFYVPIAKDIPLVFTEISGPTGSWPAVTYQLQRQVPVWSVSTIASPPAIADASCENSQICRNIYYRRGDGTIVRLSGKAGQFGAELVMGGRKAKIGPSVFGNSWNDMVSYVPADSADNALTIFWVRSLDPSLVWNEEPGLRHPTVAAPALASDHYYYWLLFPSSAPDRHLATFTEGGASPETAFTEPVFMRSMCRSAPIPRYTTVRQDVAAPWNYPSVAMYSSTGSSFGGWTQRPTGSAWSEDTRWAAGDFNGDGLTDLAEIWSYGPQTAIAVHRSTGSSWVTDPQRVIPYVMGGGFADRVPAAQWLPGDFDGDGKADLANADNLNGTANVCVRRSIAAAGGPAQIDLPSFCVAAGAWADSVKWAVGDFNGDGKADVASIWNNGWRNSITVRQSTGTAFVLRQSVDGNLGYWSDSTKWLAGDFNGDGFSDLASAWDDGGTTQVAVYLSLGTSTDEDGPLFDVARQWDSTRYPWIEETKWVAGDFDGDGKCDLLSVWSSSGANVMTVRRASTPWGVPFATSFAAPSDWLNPAGGWSASTQWCAGKFSP